MVSLKKRVAVELSTVIKMMSRCLLLGFTKISPSDGRVGPL